MDAAECDHVRFGVGRGLGQAQRVAHEIGDVLHLRDLVVVGQDHGVSLGGEGAHLRVQGVDGVGGQRGHGCTSSEMSSARTEWVSAPIEIASTPVSATARTVSRVMPPEASSRTRPAAIRDGLAQPVGRHVVEQDAVGTGGDRVAHLLERVGLGLNVQVGAGGPRGAHGLGHAAGERDVVVLDQDGRAQVGAVVRPAAAGDGRLVQLAQARGRLARVQDLDARSGDRRHITAGRGRDPGQPLQQVEGGALGCEHGAGRGANPRDGGWRLLDLRALCNEHVHLRFGVKTTDDGERDVESANDSRLAQDHARNRFQVIGDGRLGRGVAVAGVLGQGAVDHTVECSGGHVVLLAWSGSVSGWSLRR